MKAVRLTLAVILAFGVHANLFMPLSSQAQIYDSPLIDIEVQNTPGRVNFHFFTHSKASQLKEKSPARAYRLTVYEPQSHRVLWSIETSNVDATTPSVRYGTVPDGFKQLSPRAGDAPNLETGRYYSVWVHGDDNGIGMIVFVAQ
jgi:hypothetical protein